MPTPVAIAIQITSDNKDKIALVNRGVVPEVDPTLHRGQYFIFPFAADATPSIVPGYVFEANWRFVREPSTDYFTEIEEI